MNGLETSTVYRRSRSQIGVLNLVGVHLGLITLLSILQETIYVFGVSSNTINVQSCCRCIKLDRITTIA